MKSPRIIISGGGTGGHIYPAIAIANALKELTPECEILFVGANGKMEMEKVPQAGYPIKGLDVVGLQRKLTLKNLAFPFKLLKSLKSAKNIVKEFNPDVAVGVGGYASGPTLKMAEKLNIPTVLQEQNSYAGITNKLLAKKAALICVAYEGMERFFPKDKIKLTGNPVRKDILNVENKREEGYREFQLDADKKTILILGGSLGARTLNDSITQNFELINKKNDVQLIWQTGKFYDREMQKLNEKNGNQNIKALPFISRMDLAYAVADVVISRAGALSISELCLVKKPIILVPSPNVSEDHQTKNAQSLVNKKAALLVKDSESITKLVPTALELLENQELQRELSENIAPLGRSNADTEIAQEILNIIKNKRN